MEYELKSRTFAAEMARKAIILSLLMLLSPFVYAQEEDELLPQEPVNYKLKLQRFRYVKPLIEDGDTMWCYLLPELWVYPPMVFKNEKQRRAYNRLVYNVKKVLPLAKQARQIIIETAEFTETLPPEERKAHLKRVEQSVVKQYKPQMKKLTFSQGKLLIKLVDREGHSTAYEAMQAFIGPVRSGMWQAFAWMFGASLKKGYDAEGTDRLTERVVLMVEAGQL